MSIKDNEIYQEIMDLLEENGFTPDQIKLFVRRFIKKTKLAWSYTGKDVEYYTFKELLA